jgi:hypothetical protein
MKQKTWAASGATFTFAAIAMLSSPAHAGLMYGFEGTSLLDNVTLGNAFRPPDTMGAVGTNQFLESTNGSYTVYNKSTGDVLQRMNFNTFWANAGIAPVNGATSQGDQRILFDHYTNRWISVGFSGTVNKINIGVSDTSDALGAWKSTVLTALPGGPFANGTADYPTLGMDDKGLYIGTNNFTPGFRGTSLFVIPVADLLDGAPSLENLSRFDTTYAPITVDNGFAIQGAVNWGGNPTNTGSILAVSPLAFDNVFYQVNGVNAAGATQTASVYVDEPIYTFNRPGRQPDGTRLVDVLDDRISANVYQVGGKLYAVQTVTPIGLNRTVIRWSVVDANTGQLLQSGDIGLAGCDYYQGSIAVNEFGNGLIAYNRSCGSNVLPNNEGRIAFLGQQVASAGGNMFLLGAEILFKLSSNDDYRCGVRTIIDTTCRQRWGDYSAVSIDPTNHANFFAIGEYSAGWAVLPGFTSTERAIWHTYIAAVNNEAPEPGTIVLIGTALLSLLGLAVMRNRAAV